MQKRGVAKKIVSMVIAFLLACAPILTTEAAGVKPSNVEYKVVLNGSSDKVFLGNEKAVNANAGDEVYLTYTVEEVTQDDSMQSGVVATTDKHKEYPYVDEVGMMEYYNEGSLLLKPGYTYFYKFQITEYGFEYVVAYSNGSDEGYETRFNARVGNIIDGMKYFGTWFAAGKMSAVLTHVRCYDSAGNNLGVVAKGAFVDGPNYQGNPKVADYYDFELQDATSIAISNQKYSTSDIVYMEYSIGNATDESVQAGVGLTNMPKHSNPYQGNTCLYFYQNYEEHEEKDAIKLAIPGAKYLIRFERFGDSYDATIKYVLNGETYYKRFPSVVGQYNEEYGYFYLFLTGKVTAEFRNFKCYDAKGNNLGVQFNQSNIEVRHSGGAEDYSCKENGKLITLDEEQVAIVQNADTTYAGTYVLYDWDLRLVMNIDGEEKEYTYYYDQMTDTEGNSYIRLKDEYTVRFVTGSETNTELITIENGYKVAEPEKPHMKGNTFKGWCLGDGTEYNFDSIVTESITLYAKWVDGDGNEFLALEVDGQMEATNLRLVIVICACVFMLTLATVGSLSILRKKKKESHHDEE